MVKCSLKWPVLSVRKWGRKNAVSAKFSRTLTGISEFSGWFAVVEIISTSSSTTFRISTTSGAIAFIGLPPRIIIGCARRSLKCPDPLRASGLPKKFRVA